MSEKTALDKLGKAKARLLLNSPYFGTLASRLELDTSDDIPGFLSNGLRLEYNPEYVEGLDDRECEFMLANGAMHAALVHERRQNGRMSWLWQLATDHAINTMLVQNNFALPPQVNYDPRFEGMYAEAIYAQLKDEIKNEEYSDDESNDTGFNENNQRKRDELKNAEGDHDPDKLRPQMEVENSVDESLFEHFEKAVREMLEQQGDTPLGLERFFVPAKQSVVDWRSELFHALSRHLKSDYRMLPPSKKLLYNHIYLPSSTSETLDIVIAIDSSGSVDEELLGRFIAEVESLLETFADYRIELLVCDAKVQSHRQFYPGEPLRFELKGGGGTDFRPVFEWTERYAPMAPLLLYFTDCDGRFPDKEPLIDTVWITPETQSEVPFGKTIVLNI
ncbi:VWA-like domain-containing protein [Sulfurimonas sp. HSL-3221]|uniref:vWA domain-containing protein n=1 Tax=Thiomicrolovo sulfuroxydans TaxID=2894755 RepID=UPI001E586BD7|nr:VWA-like domain-containing protein [Sulfurimonas sp. HSL-3221]UFS62996.1 VWA-like domain-containing protein [Sulfurimonas sp. HSL-3221]